MEHTMEDPSHYLTLEMMDFNISVDELNSILNQHERGIYGNVTKEGIFEDILQKNESLKILIITIYVIAIITGFIENLLVFVVIARHRHLHKVTNIFIAALSLSDIMLCIFNLPFQLHYQLTMKWAFGEVLCRIIMPTFGVPIFVSTACMLMIAVDRFFLIVYPFKKIITKKKALIIIAVIVVFTFLLAMPVMIHTELSPMKFTKLDIDNLFCIENWSKESGIIYSCSLFILQFVFPLIIVTFLYFSIYWVLRKRPLKRNESRRNQRTNKILMAIVVLFAISWLPFNLFSLIVLLDHKIVYGPYFQMTDLLLKILAMSSACINPFMYGWLNDNFRREISLMLGKKVEQFKMRQNGFSNTYAMEPPSKTVDADWKTTAL